MFLNAKNDLEPFAFPNFQQMSSIGSTPEVKLVVEMGRPRRGAFNVSGPFARPGSRRLCAGRSK